MNIAKKNVYSGIFFFLFSIFLYCESYNMNVSKADPIGPQLFPRIVAICIALLAAWQILKNTADLKKATDKNDNMKTKRKLNAPLLLSAGLLLLYPFILQYVGFIILTAVYLFCQIFLLLPQGALRNRKNVVIASASSVLFTLLLYFLFTKAFQIFLPVGILG